MQAENRQYISCVELNCSSGTQPRNPSPLHVESNSVAHSAGFPYASSIHLHDDVSQPSEHSFGNIDPASVMCMVSRRNFLPQFEGKRLGADDGGEIGAANGDPEGAALGSVVGCFDGSVDGDDDGCELGESDGSFVGALVGNTGKHSLLPSSSF